MPFLCAQNLLKRFPLRWAGGSPHGGAYSTRSQEVPAVHCLSGAGAVPGTGGCPPSAPAGGDSWYEPSLYRRPPADCWVGASWERRRTQYRQGKGMVTEELHVWVCLVPCFPLHFIYTTGLRWVPAGDELRRSWGFLPNSAIWEIPGMTWSWLTRERSR
jgi:hypothetical protein